MDDEKYIESVLVTKSGDLEAIAARMTDPQMIDMVHAAMGLVTEAAEIMDALKKHLFYGRPFDLVNIEEELGDAHWYEALMVSVMRAKGHMTSFEQIHERNIAKLRTRYGGGFDESRANNRDLAVERRVLETGKMAG